MRALASTFSEEARYGCSLDVDRIQERANSSLSSSFAVIRNEAMLSLDPVLIDMAPMVSVIYRLILVPFLGTWLDVSALRVFGPFYLK